ncbi:MAG: hypothetical protein EZS28_024990 [Streblomastix strix]|uniref:Uncharacterized protein n=1 Tax=Streblomastix strix TaxID=222440 RepID=A0A5J4VAV6_9EUKA|nr:MAG: hypothetical protein EZS28_024990 [Streblomastix strix]
MGILTQRQRSDNSIILDGISNSRINESAGGSQFLKEWTRLYDKSCKQLTDCKFEYMQSFRVNIIALDLLDRIERVKELQVEILKVNYRIILQNLDMMGELASLEFRNGIKRSELTITQ